MLDAKLLDVVAGRREGVLATIRSDGRPQLSNILYDWDAQQQLARITTTAERAKARNLMRDPRGSLYVPGEHFYTFVVLDGDAEIVGPTTTPGDDAGRELLALYTKLMGPQEQDVFFRQMVDAGRLVIRLRATHAYGLVTERPPGR